MKRRAFVSGGLVSAPALLLSQQRASGDLAGGGQAPAATEGGAAAPVTTTGFESPGIVTGNLPVFFENLKADLTYPLAWGNSRIRNFADWRRAARAKVDELLFCPPDHTPFAPEVLAERDRGTYVEQTITFNITRYSRVRALLLVPHGSGPFPAALMLHDHGSKFDIGKEKLIEPADETKLASAQAWAERCFGGRFIGNDLAARGYAVLAVDALGWGDRSGLVYDGQQALASNLYNLGSSLAGLMAREDERAARFLATVRGVDRRRVTAVGFSMGSFRAWQVAALTDAVSAAVCVCWMTTNNGMMVPGNNTLRGQSAFHMLHPGLRRYLDIPDVASIAAPKPMLFYNGELDTLFPVDGVRAAYDRMATVWDSRRAGDRLHTRLWPGLGHIFNPQMQAEAFAWLDGWVRP